MRIYLEMNKQRCVLVLLCIFTGLVPSLGQPNGNYVKTVRMVDSLQNNGITSYQFYDGWGRPSLSATNGLGTSGNYAYSLQTYDAAGNINEQWLPVVGTSTIQLLGSGTIASMSSSQYGDSYGYSSFAYDGLGRQTESTMPGETWHTGNKKKTIANLVNRASDNTSHPAGSLTGETATDEDGHSLTTFYNLQGLKVRESRDTWNHTRYIYNDFGQ